MGIKVEKEKWILYKHTSDYELIKAVALDVKNNCATNINDKQRYKMQERLKQLELYHKRNPKAKSLDAINHRINTLEFYMFGYEDIGKKKFIFSPLGNLFLKYIDDDEKLTKIFLTMLFAIQFEHYANSTPKCFQLYPFRLLIKLMMDERLQYRLYSTEYAYIVAFTKNVTLISYEELVDQILKFREYDDTKVSNLLKQDEHTYVNCIYEWQYYTQKLLKKAGILSVFEGTKICKLFHPQKKNSKSSPTGRFVKNGYAKLRPEVRNFAQRLLEKYPAEQKPFSLENEHEMQIDIVKKIYSFYPEILLDEIGEDIDDIQAKLLELPSLIEKYSRNPNNETAYMFEDVLAEGFNMFINLEVQKRGGPGHTDIECLYYTKLKKFAVEAKSTMNKLTGINSGRLRQHREDIGAVYTIVIMPQYVPAAKRDIKGEPVVFILASTFGEYLYNHLYHDIREIDYKDFDDIISNNLGTDVSKLISDMTINKFATK